MSTHKPTYAAFFRFLQALGFCPVRTDSGVRAYLHANTDTLLVFSGMHAEQDELTNTDYVSAERFLREKQLIAGALGVAVRSVAKT
jgi:hypothetical protein